VLLLYHDQDQDALAVELATPRLLKSVLETNAASSGSWRSLPWMTLGLPPLQSTPNAEEAGPRVVYQGRRAPASRRSCRLRGLCRRDCRPRRHAQKTLTEESSRRSSGQKHSASWSTIRSLARWNAEIATGMMSTVQVQTGDTATRTPANGGWAGGGDQQRSQQPETSYAY
jgi:hypothetical protein